MAIRFKSRYITKTSFSSTHPISSYPSEPAPSQLPCRASIMFHYDKFDRLVNCLQASILLLTVAPTYEVAAADTILLQPVLSCFIFYCPDSSYVSVDIVTHLCFWSYSSRILLIGSITSTVCLPRWSWTRLF